MASARGLAVDFGLYALSAVFAAVTAATSTLTPHRAWGGVAAWGYAAATLVVVALLLVRTRRPPGFQLGFQTALAWLTWAATALLPLLVQAVQRAGGRGDRAQEEVVVVEDAGRRLLEHGTPYLTRDAIAALPEAERLIGYTPYQPGMALFGLPRAAFADAWWTDARVWFAAATALALLVAADRLTGRLRAIQAATVLPICALTLATGGDDLPVLALCLLALALSTGQHNLAAGLAAGAAGALKLFAWPVIAVLLIHALTRGRSVALRFATGAIGLPVLAMIPVALVDFSAFVENVVRFPLGQGLVDSPAQSPFPGHLLATAVPGGRVAAAALLVAAAAVVAVVLLRRPPRTATAAAYFCAYGLLAAILLMPSTRFGYLLYPIAFLVWAPALGRPRVTLAGTV